MERSPSPVFYLLFFTLKRKKCMSIEKISNFILLFYKK